MLLGLARGVRSLPRALSSLTCAVILASYFLYFVPDSLKVQFTHDDLMNTYRAWQATWKDLLIDNVAFFKPSPTFRPLPESIYKLSFAGFGFNLAPFRVLLLLLLLSNVGLVYCFCRVVSASRRVGLFAAVLMAYHPNWSQLYYNTGSSFDILCTFFYFAALLVYWRLRSRPTFYWTILFLILFTCALDSKEMAVSLPVIVLAIELLFSPPRDLRVREIFAWQIRRARWAWITAAMSVAYTFGRVLAPGGLTDAGPYHIDVSPHQYIIHVAGFLNDLVLQPAFREPQAWTFLGVIWVAAITMRSRAAVLGALLFSAGILPVAFIGQRGIDAIYVPLAGLALWIGMILVRVTDVVLRPIPLAIPTTLLLGVLMSGICTLYKGRASIQGWLPEYDLIRTVRTEIIRRYPTLRSGTKILFLNDPFPEFQWSSLMIIHLTYNDSSIEVDQPARLIVKPDDTTMTRYDYVLTFEGGHVVERGRGPRAPAHSRLLD